MSLFRNYVYILEINIEIMSNTYVRQMHSIIIQFIRMNTSKLARFT